MLISLRQGADARTVTAAGLDEDMDVLLSFEPRHSGSRPGIVLTVDEYHLGVIFFQIGGDFLAQRLVERHVFQLFGQHQAVQIALAGSDGEVLLERCV